MRGHTILDPVNRKVIDGGTRAGGLKHYIGGNCTVSCMLMGLSELFSRSDPMDELHDLSGGVRRRGRSTCVNCYRNTALHAEVKITLDDPHSGDSRNRPRSWPQAARLYARETPISWYRSVAILIPWIDMTWVRECHLKLWNPHTLNEQDSGRGPDFK